MGKIIYDRYLDTTADQSKTVLVATASPFKFNASTACALLGRERTAGRSEYELLQLLSQTTGLTVPPALSGLEEKPVRHNLTVSPGQIKETVLQLL